MVVIQRIDVRVAGDGAWLTAKAKNKQNKWKEDKGVEKKKREGGSSAFVFGDLSIVFAERFHGLRQFEEAECDRLERCIPQQIRKFGRHRHRCGRLRHTRVQKPDFGTQPLEVFQIQRTCSDTKKRKSDWFGTKETCSTLS